MKSGLKTNKEFIESFYVVKYLDLIHVLHAFQKKTEKTAKGDLDIAKQRLKKLLQEKI